MIMKTLIHVAMWAFAWINLVIVMQQSAKAQPAPTVEIQINRTPDPNDDFVTWAPCFCRARVASGVPANQTLAVTFSNADTNTNGRVLFDAIQQPWPANTTATQQNINLPLPGNGDWREFMVAGEVGHASVRRDDTVIVGRTSNDTEVGRQTLMVRVRKDARKLTVEERDRLLDAIRQLHLVQNRYAQYVEIHQNGLGEAHGGSAFLPWHRAFVLHFERALQRIDPSVTVPYWKYDEASAQTKPPANLQLFGEDFMGGEPTTGLATFASTNPLSTWTINGFAGVFRATANQNHTALPQIPGASSIRADSGVLVPTQFFTFTSGDGTSQNPGMEEDPHGYAHIWAGLWNPPAERRGWIANVAISPRDPLFFLLHCNVDRQWARWQWQHNRFGVTANDFFPTGNYPGPGMPDRQRIGHYLEATMWPWNETMGDPGTPADDQDDRPTVSIGGPFPAASPFLLGPPTQPRPRDMIDYLGRSDPTKGQGACYDDIPYTVSSESLTPGPNLLALQADDIATLLDGNRLPAERIAAGINVRDLVGADAAKALKIAADKEADARIRLIAFQAAKMSGSQDTIDDLIRLSKDETAPPELRRKVADRLHFIVNFTPKGHKQMGKILDAVRALLDDPDQGVRNSAVSTLVGFNDKIVFQRLADGLKNPAKEIQPAHVALANLADSGHADYFEIFDQYFRDRTDVTRRSAAARGLARIPKGHDALKEVLLDMNEPAELRLVILQSLSANDRDQFPEYAVQIAGDTNSSLPMRTYALGAISDQVESVQVNQIRPKYDIREINTKVKELATKGDSPDLRRQAWHYLQRCDKNYLQYAPDLFDKEEDSQLKLHLKDDYIRGQNELINKLKGNKE